MPKCLVDDSLINYCSMSTYNATEKSYVYLREHNEKVLSKYCCYYDGYKIDGDSIGIPKKRTTNGTFIVWGHFCSMECARAFIHDNQTSCNHGKELSLLALMGIKTYGKHFRLNRATNKFLLDMYGGPLGIEEWRKEHLSKRLWVIKTPNIERTFQGYECYLNQVSHPFSSNNQQRKEEKESKETSIVTHTISSRKTPAHFTKKSLLSFVNQN